MINWEQMKDFSYVGIKITKAKTISEGLTKCKIQKLTRQNPVYEHLKIHKMKKGKKQCQLCTSLTSLSKAIQTQRGPPRVHFKSQIDLINESKSQPLKQIQMSSRLSDQKKSRLKKLHDLIGNNMQMQAFDKFDRFKKIIEKFDKSVNRSKTQFYKIKDHSRTINNYFMTEADEIDYEMNQDRTLTVAKVQSDRMQLLEQNEKEGRRKREIENKIRQMHKPVKFPLNKGQVRAIIAQSRRKNDNESQRLNKMLNSLYDYKAKTNYANKIKIIKQYADK